MASAAPKTPAANAQRGVRLTLWLLLIVYIFNFIDRQIVNILAEPIARDLGLSDTQIGQIVADMSDRYLKGTPLADIPAVTVSDFTMVVNKTTADAIGVALPEDVLSTAKVLE